VAAKKFHKTGATTSEEICRFALGAPVSLSTIAIATIYMTFWFMIFSLLFTTMMAYGAVCRAFLLMHISELLLNA
jgi:hypothetical protein